LDLLTGTVNVIQRAWINRDSAHQISSRHLTAEINKQNKNKKKTSDDPVQHKKARHLHHHRQISLK
jgi:hypothetical protein